MRVRIAGIGAFAVAACLAAGGIGARPAIASGDPVVEPGDLNGWQLTTNQTVSPPYDAGNLNPSSTASFRFRRGPRQPPAGRGSLQMRVGDAPNSRVAAVPPDLTGTDLDSLSSLSYWTFLTRIGRPPMPINFKISVTSAALGQFTTLVFEPARQSSPTPEPREWQSWDPLTGLWWGTGITGSCSQSEPCSWSELKSLVGGDSTIRIAYFELGDSGTTFSGIVCALDDVVINRTTYDMEPDLRLFTMSRLRTPHRLAASHLKPHLRPHFRPHFKPVPKPHLRPHQFVRVPCRPAAFPDRVAVTSTVC